MRKNSKGLNNNLVSYLCKFSGVLYAMAIISSCNNGKKCQNINEKQYMPTEGCGRNRGGSGSANKETLPSKKTPIDELMEEKENNNEKHLNINEKQYSSSTEIYNNNDRKRKDNSSDNAIFKTKKTPNCNFCKQEVLNDNSSSDHKSAWTSSKDDERKSNYSDADRGKCIFSLDEALGMQPIEDEEPYKDFSKMKSVCPKCGILLDYGETWSHHNDFPNDHLLISIKNVADYVYDDDLKVFMRNLNLYKKFIGQQKIILEQKTDELKSAINMHKNIRENIWDYYNKDCRLINEMAEKIRDIVSIGRFRIEEATQSVLEMYLELKEKPKLPFTKTLITNLQLFIDYSNNNVRELRKFKDRLIRLFDCSNDLEREFENIAGIKVKEYEQKIENEYASIQTDEENNKIISNKIIRKVENNLKSINQSIENYKQQLKYIKTAKKLKERFYGNPNDSTIQTILKAFAFTMLKYTSQLEGIEMDLKPLDSGNNYQMFYGARYLDNVVMAMFFGEKDRISDGKEGEEHIPISISRAFDSKLNTSMHDSGTIGGSADGYVAILDNHRSKQLHITNTLTGESVTVLNVKNWMQPIFWKKKLLLFSTWDYSMLMFYRDEFMRNPDLSLGIKIPKERLLNLPDSFETHHTGKLFFSNIGGMIKTFDVETETITNEIQTERSFSPVPIFGKEKLDEPGSVPEILEDDLDFMYLSTPTGLFKQDPTGEYKEILKTDGTVSSMILSNKNPEDYSKALIFCWSKIYYGNKSSRRLCNIPIKPINMLMRLYSDVYYVMNSITHKWECRRIFFDEDFEDHKEHK